MHRKILHLFYGLLMEFRHKNQNPSHNKLWYVLHNQKVKKPRGFFFAHSLLNKLFSSFQRKTGCPQKEKHKSLVHIRVDLSGAPTPSSSHLNKFINRVKTEYVVGLLCFEGQLFLEVMCVLDDNVTHPILVTTKLYTTIVVVILLLQILAQQHFVNLLL